MLILKDPPQLPSTINPDLLKLVTLRLTQLTPTLPHKMIIVEPRDTLEDIETITGCPILTNLFDDVRYPASSLDEHSEIEEISVQKPRFRVIPSRLLAEVNIKPL